ncbi:MAG: DUF86 domain-containing protein [Actinomycetota bacterium]|nr:DUF86 domain-containing protein [Actinomycetota bacterium]
MLEGRVYDKLDSMMEMANRAALLIDAARRESGPHAGIAISDTELALERALYRAIQDLLDVAAMIAASIDPTPWTTYRGAIEILGAAEVLPPSALPGLREMAGFRNILAHEYGDVDRDRVLGFEAHMSDFEAFARSVVTYLDRSGSQAR